MMHKYAMTRKCRLTTQLSDPAHRTLGKPETHGKTQTQKPGSLQRLVELNPLRG